MFLRRPALFAILKSPLDCSSDIYQVERPFYVYAWN
jgi:hypothetical protein